MMVIIPFAFVFDTLPMRITMVREHEGIATRSSRQVLTFKQRQKHWNDSRDPFASDTQNLLALLLYAVEGKQMCHSWLWHANIIAPAVVTKQFHGRQNENRTFDSICISLVWYIALWAIMRVLSSSLRFHADQCWRCGYRTLSPLGAQEQAG